MGHHDAFMRTTVTLEKDVERMLREAMRNSRRSLKEALNEAVRAGLRTGPASIERSPFVVKARRMGLLEGIDPASLNKLADELAVEAVRSKPLRTRRK